MKNAVEIENLTFQYNDRILFKNLNLTIKEASFLSIIGPNNAGKSTLVKIFDNKLIYQSDKFYINPSHIILSENSTDTHDTPYEIMERILKNKKNSKEQRKQKIEEIQEKLNLGDLLDYSFHYLSESEKQIISFAVVLILEPNLLILDNAFSMLDEIIKEKIFKYLKKQNHDKKMTIINFTNDVEETIYGTEIAFLKDGQITIEPLKKALKNEKKFKECNLELPFMASLSLKLKYYGLIDDTILDINKMVNTLWK